MPFRPDVLVLPSDLASFAKARFDGPARITQFQAAHRRGIARG